ncbi:hypothetical protein QYF61_002382 [Mycteria americana]|uniref:Uncharacterized protein n=1 Tax=Mycteria americana TaxID=33587 RepID=A0AAN7SF85_MYCAM|nr:hypothetical protein QYF61_002382 [Mycteria americana]
MQGSSQSSCRGGRNGWSSMGTLMGKEALLFQLENGTHLKYPTKTLKLCTTSPWLIKIIDIQEGRAAIQRNFDRLEKWIDKNLMKFTRGKCKVLPLRRNNPRHQYRLELTGWEAALLKKIWIFVENKLNISQQCALVAKKANGILSLLARVLPTSQGSSPQLNTGETTCGVLCPAKKSQYNRATSLMKKMIRGMEHVSYEERLRELGSFSLQKRRLQGDLIAAFQYLKGAYQKDGDRLFRRACCNRTRGNRFKLKEGRFRPHTRKKFFMVRVVKHWHRLPREVADAPSLETFKVRLGRALSNLL